MDGKTIFIVVVGTIWTLFGASITAVGARYLIALKKDKNLGLLATWASQVVAEYQKTGLPGADKKAGAVEMLTGILKRNKMLSLFSEAQISAAIEVAVNLLNSVIGSVGDAIAPEVTTTSTTTTPVIAVKTSTTSVPVESEAQSEVISQSDASSTASSELVQ